MWAAEKTLELIELLFTLLRRYGKYAADHKTKLKKVDAMDIADNLSLDLCEADKLKKKIKAYSIHSPTEARHLEIFLFLITCSSTTVSVSVVLQRVHY